MATPINAPMAGEIWHLSIEDLFQPVQEAPRLGGDGPFVINLSVSTAPIALPTKPFTSSRLEAQAYQIQVTEDGRTRYRLRLGPFATEDEADSILTEVRDTYPGALTATASASDLRVIASMQAKADSRPAVQKPADNVVIDKAVSAKIAAQPSVPEKTAPEKPAPAKAAPAKAAVEDKNAAKAEAEISIDIAWPTPALVVPPSPPAHAARAPSPASPAPVHASPAPAPVHSAPAPLPAASALEWELPELDVPLPAVQKRPASAAPVVTQAATAAPKAAAKVDAPLTLVDAPTLTEVVLPAKAYKNAAKRAAIAAPVLTEVVRPKTKVPAARATMPTAATPAVAQTPAAPRATPAQTSPPTAHSPPASTSPPPTTSRPALPSVPVRTALTALVAQAAQTAPTAPAPAKSAAPIPPAKQQAPVDPQSIAHPPRKSAAARLRAFAQKATGNKLTSLQHVVVATAPVPAPREVKVLDEPLEDLESTQTLRALTPVELEDHAATRWFVIQLACADHAFDPDAVPNLDIFSEYRLYSVAGVDQGRVVHALRLGFFREEIGAVAVASYLGAYWDKPTIKRVSVAERERFANQRVEARKDVGATGKHAVIEITDELVARRRRSAKMPAAAKPSHRPI